MIISTIHVTPDMRKIEQDLYDRVDTKFEKGKGSWSIYLPEAIMDYVVQNHAWGHRSYWVKDAIKELINDSEPEPLYMTRSEFVRGACNIKYRGERKREPIIEEPRYVPNVIRVLD